jgi:hypothetical protein
MDFLRDSDRRRDLGAILVIVAVVFATFALTLHHGFLASWGDGIQVLDKESIRELSLRSVWTAFTSLWHQWAPLTWLTYAVDHAIWGLEPFGFHLTSTLCHALAAGLVFSLAHELLGLSSPGMSRGIRRGVALFAALAWALHPLRVEPVAWIAQRNYVLGALVVIPAVLAYLRHARGTATPFWRSRPYWATLALYAVALTAKSALVTLPLVLLVLDWYPLRRLEREGAALLLREKAPFLVPAALVLSFPLLVNTGGGHALGLEARLALGLRSIWDYLSLTVWPSGLSPFTLQPMQARLLDPAFLLPAAGTLLLTGVAVSQARRRPALLATWLAYLALVGPGLAAAQVSDSAMADQYTYFAAVPLSIAAAAGLAALVSRFPSGAVRAVAVAAAAAVLAALLALTVRQIPHWRDDVALWTRAIEVRPHVSGRAYFQRAAVYAQRREWQSAISDMNEAVTIASAKRYARMQDLFSVRARIRAQAGDLQGAVADLGRAIEGESSPAALAGFRGERAELYRAMGRSDLAAHP